MPQSTVHWLLHVPNGEIVVNQSTDIDVSGF